LLFFSKGKPTETVWYYEHPYPEGVKSYNKTKPMQFDEFQAEMDWWGDESNNFAARVENEFAWKVSKDEIVARNYNLDIKNPHIGEQESHDPDELLLKFNNQQEKIAGLHAQLKTILSEAINKNGEI
jgi:type I restriction enzyme M protein